MNKEQAQQLREPFAPAQIGRLPRAGITLDYVGHAAVTDRLLRVDPTWSWEPVALTDEGLPRIVVRGQVASMWIRLTVCGVTRLGVGTVAANKADVEKELVSDALRNAAMRFGVGLDLWSKEELWDVPPAGVDRTTGEVRADRGAQVSRPAHSARSAQARGGSAATSLAADPRSAEPATSTAGPRAATKKQRGFMFGLLERKGLPDGFPFTYPEDPDEFVSMKECSQWIEKLHNLPDEAPTKRANSREELADVAERVRQELGAQYADKDCEPF